jgi:hypothetical protein
MAEFGGLSGLVFVHATAKTDSSGGDFSNGGTSAITCSGVSAGTVKSCTFPCSTSISITAVGKGNVGATINFPPGQLWGNQNSGQIMCQPQDSTTQTCFCPAPPPDEGFILNNPNDNPDCEPLIVDLKGDGFFLTDADHGVMFDILANNHPFKIPWTADSRNGFLVLDRNGNGIIDNSWELFGNLSPQEASDRPNGFLSLAVYDKKEQGGNQDGVIDAKDLIYSQLRIWVDANHDGISQPEELHTLPEAGIFSISLNYSLSKRTDEFGNVFRYRAKVNQGEGEANSDAGKKIYDVFFVTR